MTQLSVADIAAIRMQDRDHVWHPLFQHRALQEGSDLMVLREANGTTVIDAEGNAYLDAYSGLWNVNVGYGRAEIATAAFEQLQKICYYPLSHINLPAAELGQRLAELMPGDLNHTFFCNSGSEANETAFKIARQYSRQKFPGQNKYKVIARYQGYHGFTYAAMSATGQTTRRAKFEPLAPGFLHVDAPYCYRCPIKLKYPECGIACVEEIEEVIRRESADTVAAVIVEPIIGGGGVIVPPDEYLPRLREICDKHNVLLILDEVITGFGRTGAMFACEHWNVVPDMMTIAKGVTSGYLPLGGCVVTPEIFEAFLGDAGDGSEFAQVSTYGGHPACCAAALANIDILLNERLWENAALVGAYLLDGLKKLNSPFVGNVRGKGLMLAVELVGKDGDFLDAGRMARVKAGIKAGGVLAGSMSHVLPGCESSILLAPPLILTNAEADTIVRALDTALSNI